MIRRLKFPHCLLIATVVQYASIWSGRCLILIRAWFVCGFCFTSYQFLKLIRGKKKHTQFLKRGIWQYICKWTSISMLIIENDANFKISVLVNMWEKGPDTRCLLRSSVLKLVNFFIKHTRGSLNNTLLNSFKNCWSQETTHDRSSTCIYQLKLSETVCF